MSFCIEQRATSEEVRTIRLLSRTPSPAGRVDIWQDAVVLDWMPWSNPAHSSVLRRAEMP